MVGLIDPPFNQKSYILICNDYLIKSVEVKVVASENEEVVANFFTIDIFARYGIPRELFIYQGS